MIYAITASVLIVFAVAYLLTRKKEREIATKLIPDEDFARKADEFVRSLPLPTECSVQKGKKYLKGISYRRFILKGKKYKGIFDDFLDANPVDMLKKVDFEKLNALCGIQNTQRVVLLARFCLASNGYVFDEDRVKTLVECHNKFRTLGFAEIMSMKQAFLYAILEKLYFVYDALYTVAKVMRLAKKYVKDTGLSATDKKFERYSKSRLFLNLCAVTANYSTSSDFHDLSDTIDGLYSALANASASMTAVLDYDFTRLYSPLEILDKFSSFSTANECCKINFLSLLAKLSDKENLDEFMFAIRLEKCVETSGAGHTKVKSFSAFGRFFACFDQKEDASVLCSALRSDILMKLYFGNPKSAKKTDSISKIIDFENTFEPIYKFSPLNFGISTTNGVLRVLPALPKGVDCADVTFRHDGVVYRLHVLRGDKEEMYIGDTRIEGTTYIKLPKSPADFTVVVK